MSLAQPTPWRTYLIALLGVLSPILGAVAGAVPAPWSGACAVAALLAGGAAGLAAKVPLFLVGKPVVSAASAASLVALSAALVDQAFLGPDGLFRSLLLAGAALCCILAGKPLHLPARVEGKAGLLLVLLVLPLALGCASAPATPKLLGPSAFDFRATPTVPIEECFAMAERQSRAASAAELLTYGAGGGAVISAVLALFVEQEAATAGASLASAGAAGGALYAKHRASSMESLLALYGCPRPVKP